MRTGAHHQVRWPLISCLLPHKANNVAWGLIAIVAAPYEAYCARLRSDPEARENFTMAETRRLILREERNFVEAIEGTLDVPSTL